MSSPLPTVSWTGLVDAAIAPGNRDWTTARMRLIVPSSDRALPDLVVPCLISNTEQARFVLTELQRGDVVRITGSICDPVPDDAFWVDVTDIQRLDTMPTPSDFDDAAAVYRSPEVTWEGVVDVEPKGRGADGRSAGMGLLISPTEEIVDAVELPAVVNDPELALTLLSSFMYGERLRVTGHLCLSPANGGLRMEVTDLETLGSAPWATPGTEPTDPGPGLHEESSPDGHADDLITIRGYVDREITKGGPGGVAVRFRVLCSAEDGDAVDEALTPCRITNPATAQSFITSVRAEDLVEVTGHLRHDAERGTFWVDVVRIRCIDTVPLQDLPPELHETGGLLCIGPYIAIRWHSGVMPVWAPDGTHLGYARSLEEIDELIEAHHQGKPEAA